MAFAASAPVDGLQARHDRGDLFTQERLDVILVLQSRVDPEAQAELGKVPVKGQVRALPGDRVEVGQVQFAQSQDVAVRAAQLHRVGIRMQDALERPIMGPDSPDRMDRNPVLEVEDGDDPEG